MALECTPIELEYIRARVVINNTFTVETPYVKNFSVNKSRSSNIGTFSASIEIPSNANIGATGGFIQIFAGTKQNYITKGPIFTGIIRRVTPQPVVGKPNYFLLSLSGNDIMSKLQNKKYSRRIPTDGPGLFVTITGPAGPRPSTLTWTTDKRVNAGKSTFTASTPDLSGREEHNSKISYGKHSKGTGVGNWLSGAAEQIIPEPIGPSGGGAGLIIHDHSDMANQGGPAFGVFSIT